MPRILTREQNIRKAKRLRAIEKFVFASSPLSFLRRIRSAGEEIFLETDCGRVRILRYGSGLSAPAPVFFDLHGGGFVLGSADMDDGINARLHKETGCAIFSIDYLKAPEHPYPAAANQIYAAIKKIFLESEAFGVDRTRMAIGGHSAGGNLGAVVCLKAKREGLIRFACQVLDYPPLDLATSDLEKPHPRGSISSETAMMFNDCYVDPRLARDPLVSPLYAPPEELAGLPPALVILAGRDSLHDEGLKYVRLLQACGVAAECHDYPRAAHGFTLSTSGEASDALEKMADFLRRHLRAS